MSVQATALAFGAWISQDLVRKANTHGEGHGSPKEGYEVLPSNVAETVRNLKLTCDEWDYMQPKPQAPAFKKWMKSHLVLGHPIVMFPMCKGDSHTPYAGSCPNGGHLDHVEPIWGIGSNHPLNDTSVYDDDWLVHGSDQDHQKYYRTFASLEDTPEMNGNCKHAQAGFGKNEMFPCIYDQVDYGVSVTGLSAKGVLPVVLAVDRLDEPDVRMWLPHANLHGTVTVSQLRAGAHYILYRYQGTVAVPTSPPFDHGYEYKIPFVASGDTWTYRDPNTFRSDGATYYIAVAAKQNVLV